MLRIQSQSVLPDYARRASRFRVWCHDVQYICYVSITGHSSAVYKSFSHRLQPFFSMVYFWGIHAYYHLVHILTRAQLDLRSQLPHRAKRYLDAKVFSWDEFLFAQTFSFKYLWFFLSRRFWVRLFCLIYDAYLYAPLHMHLNQFCYL